MIIPANFHQIGGQFRFVPKGGKATEFFVIGFDVNDSGTAKPITFPSVPKGSTVERHDGVSGWVAFDLEG